MNHVLIRNYIHRFSFSIALLFAVIGKGWGQTTVTYTIQTGNFNTLNTEKNNNPPYAGTYNFNAIEIGQYANGGSFGNTPGAAAFQTFNTTGNGNTGTARTLRVGDRFTVTCFVSANPSAGGYIGISFRASTSYTNFFSSTDAATVARFQLDNTGNWKVYSGATVVATSSSGSNADRTFSIEITSSNTFNATIGSETFYDLSFGATGPISSFAIYTYGDANANSFWKNGSLSNIGHEADTGLRFGYDMSSGSRNISGIISDGMNTNTTSGTLVNKVLSGGSGNIVIFSGGNNYSGSTTVNSNGRLELQNAAALGSTSGTTVTSGGTLSLYSATGISYNNYALSLNGTGQSGTGALLNTGGTNTWPGNITLASSSTINSTSTGGSGSLTISGNINIGANNVTFGGSGNHTTVSGAISGTGKLIKSGTNNLLLTGANTHTGNTEIDQGELWIGSGGSISSSSAIYVGNGTQTSNITKLWLSNSTGGTNFPNNLIINPGDYNTRVLGGLNTSGTHTYSGNINTTSSGYLTLSALNAGATTSFTGVISGVATQLDIEGAGTVILSGANTYTGKTYITANTLTLGVANALPVGASAGIINIDGTGTKTINLGLFNLGTATTSAGSAGKLDIDANTTINLGASGTNTYYFKASDDQTWNATTVTINNWTGSVGLTGTGPKIYVGANENGLTSTQLSKITFNGFTAGAVLLGTGELVPKPLTPTITSFTPTSGFVGTTVTITGTNFAFITSVSIGGAAAASYTVNSTTQITAVVGAGATTGVVTIVALGGTVSSATNFTIGGYITTQTGDWNTGATWLGGAVPPAGVNVTVDHLITVNASVSNAPSAVTINASDGITFGASGALTATTITNNGSIVMTSGGTLTIANGGTLTNNATFTRGSGTVRFAGSATVSGTVAFNNVNLDGNVNFGTASTVFGNFTISATGSINTNAPSYADNSTLIYSAGATTYNRFNEWSTGTTSAERGVPFNVQVNATTTLNMDANGSVGRTCRGSLTINGNFTMGNMTADIVVGQDVNINTGGSLTLGGQSGTNVGDIELKGNWNHNGGTFNNAARAVRFSGTTDQTVNFSSEEVFGYLIVNKTAGNVIFNCNALIDGGNSGFPLILDNGNIDLNGKTLRFNIWKTPSTTHDISVAGGGTRQITSSVAGAVFALENSDNNERVAAVVSSGSTLLAFGTNVTVTIGSVNGLANAGINFGNTVTTINGTLRINPRGFVRINPPTYATNSLLQYNVAGNYRRSVEWSAASGPGYPFNVQTSATTNFIAGGNFNESTVLNMAGSLTIDAGTIFDMTNTGLNNMTVPLTVGFDINNAGTLLASQSSGGNIILGRHWSRTGAGIFTPYDRSVTFNISTDATLAAPGTGETFYDLIINKPGTGTMGTNYVGYRVTLNSPVAITNLLTLTSGYFITTATNLMTINNPQTIATGGAVETFVSGPLRKLGSADFSFPVGMITNTGAQEQFHYRPIAISNLGTSADYTAQFYRANPYLQGPISTPARNKGLQLISYCEYWDLTRASGTNPITVTTSWSTHSIWPSKCNPSDPYVTNVSFLRVVPYNGNNPIAGSSANQWGDEDFGQTSTGTGSPSSYIQTISWDGALNYNKFVLGSTNWLQAPLPAKILEFKVLPKSMQANIHWAVNDESLVKMYVVERSSDGILFSPIINTTSRFINGRSAYQRYDESPKSGWNYYRLKVIDQEGNARYSTIQKVWFGSSLQVQISPNPTANVLNVYIPEPEKVLGMTIFNATGQRIREIQNISHVETINVSAYPSGHYILRLVSSDGVKALPFVKQ